MYSTCFNKTYRIKIFVSLGTRNSLDCTLILTEGDSAKTLAVAGLGVVGRDKYGVYPLRGKLLNVREATHKQVPDL
jgi:DNA topoisomerase-2